MRLALLALPLLLPMVVTAQPNSPNLLLNSGFEIGRPGDTRLRSWGIASQPAGVTCERTEKVVHAGSASARLAVAPGTEVSWYQLYQKVEQFRLGQPYTLSAWVKTEDVTDGVGAYVSLNFFGRDGARVNYKDSDAHVTGTTDWTRLTVTTEPAPQATEMRALVLLHGHGVVYFDNVQLEAGDRATDYQPSRADAAAADRAKAAQAEADAYFAAAKFARRPGHDVAILRDNFPKLGAPSDPDVLAAALKGAGFNTTFLDGVQLANPAIVNPDRFDLVVLPYGRAFPAPARETFEEYLSSGGCFLSTGGYAFDDQLVKGPNGWIKISDLPRTVGDHVATLMDFETGDLQGWSVGSGPSGPKPELALDETNPGQGRRSLRFSATPMKQWATGVSPPIPPDRFFPGWSELVFRARGDAKTAKMLVEWHERDGARWKAHVDLTTDWQQIVLLPTDFSFWPDGSPPGRGGPGDQPNLADMQSLLIGLSTEVVNDAGDYTFWIDDMRIANDPLAASRVTTRIMNTRVCRISDAMYPEPNQIGVFDPCHPLKDVSQAGFALNDVRQMPPDLQLRGPIEGMAAVGVLSVQGHGFGPDNSRLVPVIESYDRHGRPRGPLGSLMFQYAGNYQGSAWGFFGVENQDLFDAQHPHRLGVFGEVAQRLVERLFLYGTEAEYNCYRPGEEARILTRVANYGREPRTCRVTLDIREGDGGHVETTSEKELVVRPGTVETVEVKWRVPNQGSDWCTLAAVLSSREDPGFRDREMNGFVIWRDELLARGPKPTIKDTYFYQDGVPKYLVGCQNWWGTNGSISQRRTIDWERDFRMMQDLGLHVSRCFLPWQTEEQKRASDAWVYLAQKHNIVLFHTPNFTGTADPKVLAEEMTAAKEIAERYKNVPGLIVDTCNETGVRAEDDPGQRAAFNAYLKSRYGTDDRLRAAWADDPPEKPMPDVPFRWPAQKWHSLRARDVARFAIGGLTTWADDTRGAFHSVRPDLAVTPGWGQGFGWGAQLFDAPLATHNQDFTDQHYYGALPDFALSLKPLDRRWEGKPWSVGECGAREHPSFPDGETEEQYNLRFLYLQHHAFGMGMAFTESWHWRDPMAGIFPFGKIYSDFSLREAALIERNHSLLFSHLHPKYEPTGVFLLLPDSHRLGGENGVPVRALETAIDTLLGLHVHFECLCEADLAKLPTTAKTLIWPTPYCPSDETFARVVDFATTGGNLMVTGDVGYDEDRHWTRVDRVKQLTGATDVTRNTDGPDLSTVPPVEVRGAGAFADLSAYRGRPSLALKAPEANAVLREARGPVATRQKVGAGQVLFIGEPIELESSVPVREIYAAFLNLAAASRFPVAPDRADLHAFRLPTLEGGEIVIVHNAGDPTRVKVTAAQGAIEIDLAKMLPGMCVLDAQGRATQAEGQGEVSVGGKLAMKSSAHAAAIALDGKALADSSELLLLPYGVGTITVPRAGDTALQAECGEIERGKWHAFKEPVVSRVAQGSLTVECSEATRLEMILLAPEASFAQAAQRLADRVTR